MTKLLEVSDLVTQFKTMDGVVHAVNGVSFALDEGEIIGVVGESGSGKSVTMLSLLDLLPKPAGRVVGGQVMFMGNDLRHGTDADLQKVRGGQIGMVFQDPIASLNPVLSVGRQISEVLLEHFPISGAEARQRTVSLLAKVGIPDANARYDDFPHQFSGGMRQRVMIAMALACDPKILIADEPTTALDVTIQAQIVELIKSLRQESNMAIIWITHDLGLVAGIAERIVVMYAGYIVEHAPVMEFYEHPQHPYSIGLLGSVPRLDQAKKVRLVNIRGTPPNMLNPPTGCPFASRCPYVFDRCLEENPMLLPAGEDHVVACWWDIKEQAPRYV